MGKKYVLVLEDDLDLIKEIDKYIKDIEIKHHVSNKIEALEIIKRHKDTDLKIGLTKLLHELGMPSHIKGYEYVREGILLLYNDSNRCITKELYPELASIYNTSASKVERSIRHAIEISWNRGNLDLMEEVFGHSVDYDKAKPTNREYLVTVTDKLKLEYQLL